MKKGIIILLAAMTWAVTDVNAQTFRDKSNIAIGKIESDGTIRDKSNIAIGKIKSDGTVRDKSNITIGKIESNGTVRDRSNIKIGSAEGVKPAYAAVFFFFNRF